MRSMAAGGFSELTERSMITIRTELWRPTALYGATVADVGNKRGFDASVDGTGGRAAGLRFPRSWRATATLRRGARDRMFISEELIHS